MKSLKRFLVVSVMTIPLLMVTILVHETGHAVTARLLTGMKSEIHVWPGYQLYPKVGERYSLSWPEKSLAVTTLYPPFPMLPANDFLDGEKNPPVAWRFRGKVVEFSDWTMLMGSGATVLASLLSLLLIWILKPKGILLGALVLGSLMHFDMLTYSIFPVFFELPHLLVFGGSVPEPVRALTNLGVPDYFSVPAIIVLSIGEFSWLYLLLSRNVQARGSIEYGESRL